MDNVVGTISSPASIKGALGAVYGKDGKSAYEIALQNGFEGTEAEWLASLKGEKGEKGTPPSFSFRYDEETGGLYYEVGDIEVLDEGAF